MTYKTLSWIALVGLCVLAVPRTARSDAVMVAGGARLTEARTNFASSKIVTGGGKMHLTYQFTFEAAFDISGATIQMEDEAGRLIKATPDRGITRVRVAAGSRTHATPVSPPCATATHACKPDIPAGKTFTVDVTAKTAASAVRFSLSFSSGPSAGSARCTRLADVEAGQFTVARPFLPRTAGLSLRVANNTKHAIGFARFSLLGSIPGIAAVSIPDGTFAVVMDGEGAFKLTGDRLEPGETVQMLIFFEAAASGSGALVARFAGS